MILLTLVLILVLQKQGKETALLLSVLVCCLAGGLALGFLRPVLEFMSRLQALGTLDNTMLQTLLKVVGIAITSEVAGLICTDAGSSSLGKILQFLASCVILWLSLPMLTTLLDLVEGILGKL